MNIDRDVVSKLLQDKGFLRFKPFNLNDGNEVYAYYSEEHGKKIFHFCDNKLHDLKRKDIGLQDGVLIILGTSEAYSLMEEYTHVKGVSPTYCTKVSLSIIIQKEAIIFICLNSQKRSF